MKITILCVGKIKESFYRDAILEYSKRLSRYCKLEILEMTDEKTPDQCSEALEEQILMKEGDRILKSMPTDAYRILLDLGGKKLDSPGLSKKMEELGVYGTSHLCFIIGGSLGVHNCVRQACDFRLSFSDMTFPHQLMRVILLEQIYRGFRIMNHEPYHK